MADDRELKRARLSGPDADQWDFLEPWCEQLRGRLVWFPGRYIRVLWPGAHRFQRGEIQIGEQFQRGEDAVRAFTTTTGSVQYEARDWHTREALELLTLVHCVSHRAWLKVLVEKFQLRFGNEEEMFDANNDDDEENFGFDADDAESESTFTFECEHDRDLPPSPQFEFDVRVGGQYPGGPSPITKWANFFMAHESDYSPSPEFLEAREHILRMMRETHGVETKHRIAVEIPVALQLTTERSGNDHFPAHMKQLQELIESMKHYSEEGAAAISKKEDLRVECPATFTYTVQLLSLDIFAVEMTKSCVESVLGVLGTGVAIGSLELNLYSSVGPNMRRQEFAMFLTGVLVGPLESMLLPVPEIDILVITCGDNTSWHCEALCSTLASARTPVTILEIRGGFGDGNGLDFAFTRKRQLRFLAEALFYPRSFSGAFPTSIRGIKASSLALTDVDLMDMANVVDEKDSLFCIIQNSGQRLLLREGTALRFADSEANNTEIVTKNGIVLPFQFKANRTLLHDTARKSKVVDVVVSGYGHCFVPGESVVVCPAHAGHAEGEPISSLWIYLFEASEEALRMLLDRIGWSLRSLTLEYFFDLDDDKLMTSIVTTCPLLTSLHIHTCDVNLNCLATAYERFGKSSATGISSLVLEKVDCIGPDHGVAFAKLLGDPTSHLAKHLRELTIWNGEESEAVNNSTLRALWLALKNNAQLRKLELVVAPDVLAPWKRRFRQFHGQVLLPKALSQKLALLSVVCLNAERETKSPSALHQLDQRVLSLVFEFAITRVIRSVPMFYAG